MLDGWDARRGQLKAISEQIELFLFAPWLAFGDWSLGHRLILAETLAKMLAWSACR